MTTDMECTKLTRTKSLMSDKFRPWLHVHSVDSTTTATAHNNTPSLDFRNLKDRLEEITGNRCVNRSNSIELLSPSSDFAYCKLRLNRKPRSRKNSSRDDSSKIVADAATDTGAEDRSDCTLVNNSLDESQTDLRIDFRANWQCPSSDLKPMEMILDYSQEKEFQINNSALEANKNIKPVDNIRDIMANDNLLNNIGNATNSHSTNNLIRENNNLEINNNMTNNSYLSKKKKVPTAALR